MLRYQHWGVVALTFHTNIQTQDSDHTDKWWFVKKNVKVKYTEQENKALAVFSIIIVLSVTEIILAAVLAKVSDSSHKGVQQPTIPTYAMYYQVILKCNHTMKHICVFFSSNYYTCIINWRERGIYIAVAEIFVRFRMNGSIQFAQ